MSALVSLALIRIRTCAHGSGDRSFRSADVGEVRAGQLRAGMAYAHVAAALLSGPAEQALLPVARTSAKAPPVPGARVPG